MNNGLRLYVDRQSKTGNGCLDLILPYWSTELYQSRTPGARQEYIENPGWAGFPEKSSAAGALSGRTFFTRAMLIQRSNRSDPGAPG